MYDNPTVLNLHLSLRDSIYQEYVRPPFAVEDRKLDEVAHLASVRRQKVGNGTLGIIYELQKTVFPSFFALWNFIIKKKRSAKDDFYNRNI